MGLKPMFGMQIPLVWTIAPGQADFLSMFPNIMSRCLLWKTILSGVYFQNIRQWLEQLSIWSLRSVSVNLSRKSFVVGRVCSKQAQ